MVPLKLENGVLHVAHRQDGDGKEKDAAALIYGIDPTRMPLVNIPEITDSGGNSGGDSSGGNGGGYFQGNGTESDGTPTVLLERNFARNSRVDVGDIRVERQHDAARLRAEHLVEHVLPREQWAGVGLPVG